jgi:CubicO group peptidase (beta-lactamase class C family)
MALAVAAIAMTGSVTDLAAQPHAATVSQRAEVEALFVEFKPGEPGAAVVVARGPDIVFAAGYGLADIESGIRVGPGTAFRLASVSKQFTAVAILTLVEDGRLRLDDRLADVLPGAPPYAGTITVRHLLGHTSGIPDYEPLLGSDDGPQVKDRDILTLIRGAKRLYFKPGSSWRYSNTGYALLALIVERASGESFASYLRRRVFDRAGMPTAVAHEAGVDTIVQRAFGHTRADGTWRRTDQNRTSAVLGDGGIYASAEELANWSAALEQNAVVAAATFREATTPGVLTTGAQTSYGYGWFLDSHRGHRRQRHEGDSIGFRTAIQRYPDDRLTVIVLVNRGAAPIDALSDGVANVFLDR